MVKKAKKISKVIIPNIPADARRNLAKLERARTTRHSAKRARPVMDEETGDAKELSKKDRVLAIYRSEGIDAACCGVVKTSKALRIILKEIEKTERKIKNAREDASR